MSNMVLPPSASGQMMARDEAMSRISDVPTPAREVWSPWNCPAELLPWLAWAFSVDTWDVTWSEAQKRGAIAASYGVHRRKGTVGAVRRALAGIGLDLELIEWWQETPKGEPYTFKVRVNINQGGVSQSQMTGIIDVVTATKNLRSHFAGVNIGATTSFGIYTAIVVGAGHAITIQAGN